MELRQYLNDVVLVEVHRTDPGAGLRFFVRLAGDRILDASPVPLMNRYLDEAFADGAGQIMIDVRRDVVSTGKTYYWYGPPRMKFKLDFVETVEYAHCPLAEDGVTVDRIVSVFSYGGAK